MADIAKLFLDGARPVAKPANNGSPNPTAPRRGPQSRPAPRDVPEPSPVHSHTTLLGLAAASPDTWRRLSAAAASLAAEQSTTVALAGFLGDARHKTFIVEVHGAESADELPVIAPSSGAADLQIARGLYTLRPSVGVWLLAAPDVDAPAFAGLANKIPEWLLACPTDNAGLLATYQHLKRAAAARGAATVPSAFLVAEDSQRAATVYQRLRMAAQEFLKTDLRYAGFGALVAGRSAAPVRVLTLPVVEAEASLWACIVDELSPSPAEAESSGAEFSAPIEKPVAQKPASRPPSPPAPPRPVLNSPTPRVIPPAHVESTTPTDVETALEQLASTADDVARTSAAAAHLMLDHLANVLDPEEREALTAAFDDLPEDNALPVGNPPEAPQAPRVTIANMSLAHPPLPVTVSAPTKSPAAAPVPIAHTPVTKSDGTVTLRAFDLEKQDRSRAAQWQAVERSIRDLVPDSVLLEARPPMSWAADSCIALDPAGRLHVWTLYKDGTSWFALREWASEHRRLLGLTKRDSAVCDEAPVVVHIVLPLEDAPASPSVGAQSDATVVNTILRTPTKHIHVYRLRMLQWESRRGMVVVPIA